MKAFTQKYDFKGTNAAFDKNDKEYIKALLSSDEAPVIPSSKEYQEAVKSIAHLMKKLTDFAYKKTKDSELAHDLMMMGGYNFSTKPLWSEAQGFFEYANKKFNNLPQAEIYKNIAIMKNYTQTH